MKNKFKVGDKVVATKEADIYSHTNTKAGVMEVTRVNREMIEVLYKGMGFPVESKRFIKADVFETELYKLLNGREE